MIGGGIDEQINKQDCLSWKAIEGYLSHTDVGAAQYFFRPNSVGYKYKDTSNYPIREEVFMVYAYKNVDSMLSIVLHEGLGDTITRVLEIKQIDSMQFNTRYFLSSPSLQRVLYKPNKVELVLDKYQYSIGDTMRGYTFFQGVNDKKEWFKINISFKCIIGKNSSPVDNISNYFHCEGIVNELGFGRTRKKFAPARH